MTTPLSQSTFTARPGVADPALTPPGSGPVTPPARRLTPAKLLTFALLLVVSLIYIGPFLWMLSTSLKSPQQIANPGLNLLPNPVQWHNYPRVASDPAFDLLLYARNTVIIAGLFVVGAVFSSSLAAYSFAKLRWRGRNVAFAIVLCTMMVPFSVVMVPQYEVFRQLGWIGTSLPLWVPSFFGIPFYIFLLRQFYITIPNELLDAARIDGCSEFGIWWRIVLPLAKPALTVVAVFAFMAAWNDFLSPLVYLVHKQQFTLALALQSFQSQSGGTSWELLMAASTIVLTPVLLLFFLAQRTFIQGIATTGMKG